MGLDANGNPIIETGDGGQDPTPEKTFTQAEVNGIIAERLGRENVHDAKEIVELLKDFGYEGSPAEIKVILREQAKTVKEQREQQAREKELEDLQDQAAQNGTSPELLAAIKRLESKIANMEEKDQKKAQEAQAQIETQKRIDAELAEFNTKYPDIDLDKLAENEKFNKFVKRSNVNLSLTEIYEDYVELIGDTEKAAIAKVKSNLERSTSSGKAKGGNDVGGTYGLTPRQQALATDAKMSFKKYADNLSLIKK